MNDGGPAFPFFRDWDDHHGGGRESCDGMSVRDYFAAKAMHAMLNTELRKDMWASVEKIAQDAYKQADAMLKARGE
jgi:hypothetical protein